MPTIPALSHHEGSWVATSPSGELVIETFWADLAQEALDKGWRVETIGQYLGRINSEIREAR